MIVAISNPMGQALGDLIVPLLVSDQIKSDEIKTLLLIVGSGTSLVSLSALMISHRPPSPPSALSQLSRQSPFTGFRILFGFRPPSSLSSSKFVSRDQKLQPAYEMNLCRSSLHQINPTLPSESPCTISGPGLDHLPLGSLSQRDRLDFLILTLLFGTLVGQFSYLQNIFIHSSHLQQKINQSWFHSSSRLNQVDICYTLDIFIPKVLLPLTHYWSNKSIVVSELHLIVFSLLVWWNWGRSSSWWSMSSLSHQKKKKTPSPTEINLTNFDLKSIWIWFKSIRLFCCYYDLLGSFKCWDQFTYLRSIHEI